MEYSSFTYVDESVHKTTVWNIAVLNILMSMEYSSFTYFDENVYKTEVWNIAVSYISMKMYINLQYGI